MKPLKLGYGLMVQKSGEHQSRLVIKLFPLFTGGFSTIQAVVGLEISDPSNQLRLVCCPRIFMYLRGF